MKTDAVHFSGIYEIISSKCGYMKLCMELNHKHAYEFFMIHFLSVILADAAMEMFPTIFEATSDNNSLVRICI